VRDDEIILRHNGDPRAKANPKPKDPPDDVLWWKAERVVDEPVERGAEARLRIHPDFDGMMVGGSPVLKPRKLFHKSDKWRELFH
jgi:hypothetical protein